VRSRWVVAAVLVAAAALLFAKWTLESTAGRTPPSDFVYAAFGNGSVVFDQTFPGEGSSEDRVRVLVLRAAPSPRAALTAIKQRGEWREVGEGITRRSDDLCVVAWSGSGYTEDHGTIEPALAEVLAGEDNETVLSLGYC
jgi:hypothetical protein